MKLLISIANGVTITTSMISMSYLYRSYWRVAAPGTLLASAVIGGVTAIVTALQFAWPAILPALRRDLSAFQAGEWWRLVTPLFVQPYGMLQVLFNGLFLAVFLPICERLFGRGVWAIYFFSGIVGQVVNYRWSPTGGGSSTAAFGLMGALLVFLLRQRKQVPAIYTFLPLLGLCGALTMSFLSDGHGPGLLAGAAIAAVLPVLQTAPQGHHTPAQQ